VKSERLERLANWSIPEAQHDLSVRDCMLYGLSVGLGNCPTDEGELRFATETGTRVVPSMVLTSAAPGFWFKDPTLELDWAKMVNVTQSLLVHDLPAPPAKLRSRSRVVEVIDKGKGRGALMSWERSLWANDDSKPCAVVTSTVLFRGDGFAPRVIKAWDSTHCIKRAASRGPDRVREVATSKNSGLLYRLNGTLNPLHADPVVARSAGFSRPIMPGTASIGFVCALLLREVCEFEPDRLKALGAKLTAPIYPGDLLRCELWFEASGEVLFRVSAPERDAVVLQDGCALLSIRQ
jgi:acyl dehydratase